MKYNTIELWIPFFILLLLTFACDNPEYETYSQWDANEDELIDENEFNDAFLASDYVADWDLDADGVVTYGELYDLYYTIWDTDNDNVLTQEEWSEAVNTYFADYDYTVYGDFGDWDLNDDGVLTKNEYMEGVLDTDLFETWDLDSDATITEEEFSRGMYQYWDTDGDGYVEVAEYEKWYPNYTDM